MGLPQRNELRERGRDPLQFWHNVVVVAYSNNNHHADAKKSFSPSKM